MLERIETERPCFYCARCRSRNPVTPADWQRWNDSRYSAHYNSRTRTFRCVVCAGPVRFEPEPQGEQRPGGHQLFIYDQLE